MCVIALNLLTACTTKLTYSLGTVTGQQKVANEANVAMALNQLTIYVHPVSTYIEDEIRPYSYYKGDNPDYFVIEILFEIFDANVEFTPVDVTLEMSEFGEFKPTRYIGPDVPLLSKETQLDLGVEFP